MAIFGTTISPYLFFWQASQEVEEIKNVGPRKPLVTAPSQGANALQRIKVDTYIGSGVLPIWLHWRLCLRPRQPCMRPERPTFEHYVGGRGIKTDRRSFRVRHFHNWRGWYRIVGRAGAGGLRCLCHR